MERLVGEDDDLDVNPMYKAFLTQYTEQYNILKAKGGFICIPQSSIMQGVQINKALIDGHTFISSPLFVGQFTSLNRSKAKEEDGGKVIVVTDKFGDKRVHVLSQEELYSDGKTIRVLVVDGFLTDVIADETYANMGAQEIRKLKHQQYILSKFPSQATFEECSGFLTEVTQASKRTSIKVGEALNVFCNSHHFVRGFEEYTVGKVRELVNMAEDNFICAVPGFRRMHKVPRYALQLKLIIECFVLGSIHGVVWDGLTRCFKEEDVFLCHQMRTINSLSSTLDIGLKKELEGKVPEAAETLNELANCKTPIEMLNVFQKVVDSFSQKEENPRDLPDFSGFGGGNSGGDTSDDEDDPRLDGGSGSNIKTMDNTAVTILAGDDVLPALVSALIYSSSQNLYTTCFYIDNFLFFDLSSTSLGYIHATLKAAIEYIAHTYESLPEEKKSLGDDESYSVYSTQPYAGERKNGSKQPPPLMNAPLGTVKAAPLPGAASRMYDKAPNLELGTDPRKSKALASFLQAHKRVLEGEKAK